MERLFPVSLYKGMLLKLASKNLKFETKYDLIDLRFAGRPELPSSQVYLFMILNYAGKTRSEKFK